MLHDVRFLADGEVAAVVIILKSTQIAHKFTGFSADELYLLITVVGAQESSLFRQFGLFEELDCHVLLVDVDFMLHLTCWATNITLMRLWIAAFGTVR